MHIYRRTTKTSSEHHEIMLNIKESQTFYPLLVRKRKKINFKKDLKALVYSIIKIRYNLNSVWDDTAQLHKQKN